MRFLSRTVFLALPLGIALHSAACGKLQQTIGGGAAPVRSFPRSAVASQKIPDAAVAHAHSAGAKDQVTKEQAGAKENLSELAASADLRRLTREEWHASVGSLLGVDIAPSLLPVDDRGAGLAGRALDAHTNDDTLDLYLNAAVEAAKSASKALTEKPGCLADAAKAKEALPAGVPCVRAWALDFLRRAFRVSPTASADAELTLLLATLNPQVAGEMFASGLTRFLASSLSSTRFLYRFENARGAMDARLSNDAIAEKLVFLLWQRVPDTAFLEAVGKRDLTSSAVRLEVLDLLWKDPRAERGVQQFVLEWLGAVESRIGSKSAGVRSGLPSTFAASAEEGMRRTIADAVFRGKGTLSSLIASEVASADGALAALYGVPFPAGSPPTDS